MQMTLYSKQRRACLLLIAYAKRPCCQCDITLLLLLSLVHAALTAHAETRSLARLLSTNTGQVLYAQHVSAIQHCE